MLLWQPVIFIKGTGQLLKLQAASAAFRPGRPEDPPFDESEVIILGQKNKKPNNLGTGSLLM